MIFSLFSSRSFWRLSMVVALCLVGSLLVNGLYVASAFSFGPSVIDVSGDPGQMVLAKMKVKNTESFPVSISFSASNATTQDEYGTPVLIDDPRVTGLASWIVEPSRAVTLQPAQEQLLDVKISIPATALPGGYYAAIVARVVPLNLMPSPSHVTLGSAGASLVLLRVRGEVSVKHQVSGISMKDDRTFFSHLPVSFLYRVVNSGGVHIRPSGQVMVRNMLGFETAAFSANPQHGAVLPGTTRRYDMVWGDPDADSQPASSGFLGKVLEEIRYFAFGRYTATFHPMIDGQPLSSSSVVFWVIPYYLLSCILLVFVILFLTLYLIRYRYQRRAN